MPEASLAVETDLLRHATLPTPVLDTPVVSESRSAANIIDRFQKHELEHCTLVKQEMGFNEFLTKVLERPELYIRNTSQYTTDAMDSYGWHSERELGQDIRVFNFTKWPWQSKLLDEHKELIGQNIPTYEFYKLMQHFAKQDHPYRMIILHGPPGGGKTRLAETLDALLEDYSKNNPEGARYRLSWVFDSEAEFRKKTKIQGFAPVQADEKPHEDLSGGYRIPASLHTNPIFLLPNENGGLGSHPSMREELFHTLEKSGKLNENFNKNYFLSGVLDSTSQTVFESLLRYYKGDLKQVLDNHVRVERWTYSAQVGRGLACIRPLPDTNSDVEPLYPRHPALRGEVPEELAHVQSEIHTVQGIIPNANGGHVHWSDLLRDNSRDRSELDLSRLDYLLDTIEGGRIQVRALQDSTMYRLESVDVVLRADTNDNHIIQKRQGSGWEAWRQRCRFLPVPLMRRFMDEAAAQEPKLNQLLGKRALAPHALNTLALFVTSTRLLLPNADDFSTTHEDLPNAIRGMTSVEKALFLQGPSKDNPETDMNILRSEDKRWTMTQLRLLRDFEREIAEEHMKGVGDTRFSLYDGGMGISTRETQDLLRSIVAVKESAPVTILEVIQVLDERLKAGFKYDQDVAAKKQHYQNQLIDEATRGDTTQRSTQEMNKLAQSASSKVNKLFPISNAQQIVDQVKQYARRKVRQDVMESLGLMNDKDAGFLLHRYIEHVRAYTNKGNFTVRKEFRSNNLVNDGGANEQILQDFENRFIPTNKPTTTMERVQYRSTILSKLASWSITNPDIKFEGNMELVYPDLLSEIRKVQWESKQKTIDEFIQSAKTYMNDAARLTKAKADATQSQKANIFESAVTSLVQKGYPRETLMKHLVWAFD